MGQRCRQVAPHQKGCEGDLYAEAPEDHLSGRDPWLGPSSFACSAPFCPGGRERRDLGAAHACLSGFTSDGTGEMPGLSVGCGVQVSDARREPSTS